MNSKSSRFCGSRRAVSEEGTQNSKTSSVSLAASCYRKVLCTFDPKRAEAGGRLAMHPKRADLFFGVVLLFVLTANLIRAQDSQATLSGTVTDSSGKLSPTQK
jgi:hypothetical protein